MILWILLGGHHKNGLLLGLFLCILGSFFKVKIQNENGDIFWALLKFQIFFGVYLIFQIFLTVDAECRPVFKEKMRVPPPLGLIPGVSLNMESPTFLCLAYHSYVCLCHAKRTEQLSVHRQSSIMLKD